MKHSRRIEPWQGESRGVHLVGCLGRSAGDAGEDGVGLALDQLLVQGLQPNEALQVTSGALKHGPSVAVLVHDADKGWDVELEASSCRHSVYAERTHLLALPRMLTLPLLDDARHHLLVQAALQYSP